MFVCKLLWTNWVQGEILQTEMDGLKMTEIQQQHNSKPIYRLPPFEKNHVTIFSEHWWMQ